MLYRVSCARCRLASLWTDEPIPFLATVCQGWGTCEAVLLEERFGEAKEPPMEAFAP